MRGAELTATTIHSNEVPLLVDELPLFALLAAHARGESWVYGAGELRHKETDRIDARRRRAARDRRARSGARTRASRHAACRLVRAAARSTARGDHRIAMLGAVAGLASREGVETCGGPRASQYPSPVSTTSWTADGDDRRHRRAGRRRQEHGRPQARGAARLPLPRHRRDVSRADVARDPRGPSARRGRRRSAQLARRNPVIFDEIGRVFIAGTDVTSAIRQSRIDRMVPVVARHHEVREVMRERQRELGQSGQRRDRGPRHRHRRRARRRGEDLSPGRPGRSGRARRQAERPDIGADALATDLRTRDAHGPRAHAARRGRRC